MKQARIINAPTVLAIFCLLTSFYSNADEEIDGWKKTFIEDANLQFSIAWKPDREKGDESEKANLDDAKIQFPISFNAFGDSKREIAVADTDESTRQLIKAAESGDTDAQMRLGQMYEYGDNVERTPGLAFKWYKAAYESGKPEAKSNYAYALVVGIGCECNPKEGRKILEGMKNRNIESDFLLAYTYLAGLGGEKKEQEAYRIYLSYALEGYHEAEYMAGLLSKDGTGIPQNLNLASFWLHRAALSGHKDAQEELERLEKQPIK